VSPRPRAYEYFGLHCHPGRNRHCGNRWLRARATSRAYFEPGDVRAATAAHQHAESRTGSSRRPNGMDPSAHRHPRASISSIRARERRPTSRPKPRRDGHRPRGPDAPRHRLHSSSDDHAGHDVSEHRVPGADEIGATLRVGDSTSAPRVRLHLRPEQPRRRWSPPAGAACMRSYRAPK
jgi:hypothetical protein